MTPRDLPPWLGELLVQRLLVEIAPGVFRQGPGRPPQPARPPATPRAKRSAPRSGPDRELRWTPQSAAAREAHVREVLRRADERAVRAFAAACESGEDRSGS